MKTAALSMASVLLAASLFGQYGPPARDLDEAVRLLQEVQRQIEPAVAAARDEAAVLNVITRAQNELKGNQPVTAVDSALNIVDEFVERREKNDRDFSRDLRRTLASVRREIEQARVPPHSLEETRERLHHQYVHPLQRQVMRNAQHLQQFAQFVQAFEGRYLRPAMSELLGSTAFASTDPK